MRFCWSTVYVNSMEKSLQFYTKLVGLSVEQRFNAGPTVEIVFLGDGETKVELICDQHIQEVEYSEYFSLGFEVESLEKMIELTKIMNISIHSGPIEPNPKVKFFYVKDPNGIKIQFVEMKK